MSGAESERSTTWSVRVLAGTALVLAACGSRSPLDDIVGVAASGGAMSIPSGTGGRAGAGAGGGPVGAGGEDREPATPCRARDIGSSLGFPAAEGVLAGRSAASTECGGKGPENWFLWTPPFDGSFSFQAEGGQPPPIVALFDGADCQSPQHLQCSSALPDQFRFYRGQRVLVEVDTDAAGGGFVLDIWGAAGKEGNACADVDLGSFLGNPARLGPFTFDTSRIITFACTGDVLPTVATSWTAPHAGYFVFDTTGSNADTLLEVRTGCGSESLGCSDDYVGRAARLQLYFTQGGKATIYVGSKSGRPEDHYTLAITEGS